MTRLFEGLVFLIIPASFLIKGQGVPALCGGKVVISTVDWIGSRLYVSLPSAYHISQIPTSTISEVAEPTSFGSLL